MLSEREYPPRTYAPRMKDKRCSTDGRGEFNTLCNVKYSEPRYIFIKRRERIKLWVRIRRANRNGTKRMNRTDFYFI